MRRRLVLGLGLVGAFGTPAAAQFAADAKPTQTPPAFGGAKPMTPAYVPPVGGFQPPPPTGGFTPAGGTQPAASVTLPPVQVEIPSALGANHPWQVKPEHGKFFLSVKSYARPAKPTPEDNGPTARALAEALGTEIRETHKVNVFLFEHISDERRAEAAAIAAARQRQQEFYTRMGDIEKQTRLRGDVFLEPENKIRYTTVKHTDQIAVLIGGFNTEDDARKALDVVKKWAPPKQQELMDGGVIHRQAGGQSVIEKTRLNPFASAMVVPNPSVKQARPDDRLEPFVVKLNEGRPYSLLKATKPWTLGVKSFMCPVTVVSRGEEENSSARRMGSKGADALAAGAEQAEALAKALRELKDKLGNPVGFEAFVLHTRNASMVTVGQFDSPDDPALHETLRRLNAMQLNVTKDRDGTQSAGATAPTLFTKHILPMPVPRR